MKMNKIIIMMTNNEMDEHDAILSYVKGTGHYW